MSTKCRTSRRRIPTIWLLGKADGSFVDVAEQAGVASTETLAGQHGGGFQSGWPAGYCGGEPSHARADLAQYFERSRSLAPGEAGAARPNRDGIGAWIEVKRGETMIRREITSGGGHASGHLGWWHFGLGTDDEAEVRVLWPDGTQGPWQRVAADTFHILNINGNAARWEPKG